MNTPLIATLLVSTFAVLSLSACSEHGHEHVSDGSHPPAADAGHGHEHGPGGEKITHFTDRTELFVEFPRLVVGEKSAFAAHLTTLADFRALAAGKVSVILSGGGQPDEVFSTSAPAQPGIFRPEATPRVAGVRELDVEVVGADFTVRHRLGPVTIHPDRKSADAVPGEHDEDGIAFTKEQQWKVDFATAEVTRRVIRSAIAATGTLRARPDGEAPLTAPMAGQVQPSSTFPHLGQVVKKGDILAYLSPRLGGDTDLASLRADARKARVALDLSAGERARLEGLFRDEAVPEKRVLAARAAEASARAGFDAAQGRLDQYGGGAGGVPLRAPASGAIADVRVSPGAFAQEGALLFHIADRRMLWLELRVSESDAARLATPSGASFRVEGIEKVFDIVPGRNGRLIATGGAIDSVTRTVPVIFEIPLPDERLRLGMGVKAQVYSGAARERVAVPGSAVVDESGVATVFVMSSGESFARRPVRLGARDGDWVEIVEGLEPGQRVVSRGAYLLKLAATGVGAIGHGHAH